MITKSTKLKIKRTKLEVVTLNKKDNTVEATIEVSDEDGKGNARLQIWGPKSNSKRSNCTVQISKVEGHDTDHVEKLANNMIIPLLEHLPTCNICGEQFETKHDLNNHMVTHETEVSVLAKGKLREAI